MNLGLFTIQSNKISQYLTLQNIFRMKFRNKTNRLEQN